MKIKFSREARATPEAIGGLQVPYAAAKRAAPRWRWYLILALVASPAAILIIGMLGSLITRSAQGSVALDQMEVRALAAGTVVEVAVEPGDAVSAGMALVSTQPTTAAPASSTVAFDATSATVPRHARVSAAEVELKARMLRLARVRRDSFGDLVAAGAATAAELREAEFALSQAEETYVVAQRAAAAARTAAVLTTSRRIDQPSPSHRTANPAPFEGQVLDVFVAPGEIIRAGDPLVLLGRHVDPKVIAYVPPSFATRVAPGTAATILFADGTRSRAKVSEPARVTRRMPADLVDNFGMRPMMVVLELATADAWPIGQTIHGMPVGIRFHYDWERLPFAATASPLLDRLARSP
jgi:biotin carboxyl carrier protein